MAEKARVHAKTQESEQKCSNPYKQNHASNSSGSTADRILQLQKTAGNQAVQKLIKSRALQAKLKIGPPNDIYEQEADRVAEQIMRMPDSISQSKCTKRDEGGRLLHSKTSPEKVPPAQGQPLPPIVHEVLQSSGQPLDAATRAFMEPRFGYDFSKVRVHNDTKAVESARAVNALAYTVGPDIVFGDRQHAPTTNYGQQLIAHELAHVLQQHTKKTPSLTQISLAYNTSEPEADTITEQSLLGYAIATVPAQLDHYTLQRQTVPGGGATPGAGEGIDLIFIIKAPDDPYTSSVTKYIKTVLRGQLFEEVDNLDQIFSTLDNLSRPRGHVPIVEGLETPKGMKPYFPALKVRRIRIVAHGSTTGGVKMTPTGEKKRRWFTPNEVKTYTNRSSVQGIIKRVMTPDAVVEFWGCNIGNIPEAGEAWSSLFGSKFKATTETFKTGFDKYYRPAARNEGGKTIPNQRGKWVQVTHTGDVDNRSRGLQDHFRQWLFQIYEELVQNGDILPINDKAEQLKFMRDLFDRSNGDIKHITIMKKSNESLVRPGDQANWAKLWVEFPPLDIGGKP